MFVSHPYQLVLVIEFIHRLRNMASFALASFYPSIMSDLLTKSFALSLIQPLLPSRVRMTRKSGSASSRNSLFSTLISVLLLAGPRTVCPTAPRAHTTALPVPRTPLDVPLPMPSTVPVFTPESRSVEPTERSCLDSRNTR